jgi:hypothetical protein
MQVKLRKDEIDSLHWVLQNCCEICKISEASAHVMLDTTKRTNRVVYGAVVHVGNLVLASFHFDAATGKITGYFAWNMIGGKYSEFAPSIRHCCSNAIIW